MEFMLRRIHTSHDDPQSMVLRAGAFRADMRSERSRTTQIDLRERRGPIFGMRTSEGECLAGAGCRWIKWSVLRRSEQVDDQHCPVLGTQNPLVSTGRVGVCGVALGWLCAFMDWCATGALEMTEAVAPRCTNSNRCTGSRPNERRVDGGESGSEERPTCSGGSYGAVQGEEARDRRWGTRHCGNQESE